MALCRPLRSVSLAIAARPSRITGSSLSLLDPCRLLSEPLLKKARCRRTRMRCYDRRGCGGMVKEDGHPEDSNSPARLAQNKRSPYGTRRVAHVRDETYVERTASNVYPWAPTLSPPLSRTVRDFSERTTDILDESIIHAVAHPPGPMNINHRVGPPLKPPKPP
ncbi:hypothetical protein C8Q76DRAFT_697878 [Earliella scabrosa]|nr:hypothetical protein C8Q76DRAFT_697878 [Earliella scabrosa]